MNALRYLEKFIRFTLVIPEDLLSPPWVMWPWNPHL